MFAREGLDHLRDVVPDDLETIPPGPFLAAILSGIDRSNLNGYDAVRVLQAETRMASHYEALALESISEVAHCSPAFPDTMPEREDLPLEFASEEIQAALKLTRRAADVRLGLAITLRFRLPVVWQLLHDGRIDARRAQAAADGLDHLSEEDARAIVERILDDLEFLTPERFALGFANYVRNSIQTLQRPVMKAPTTREKL